MNNSKKSIGLYIHIPFCKSKCYYCDFNSFSGVENLMEPYFYALKREIISYSQKLRGYSISSVFIGGGTPSFVTPQYIYEVIEECRRAFNIDKGAEISLEANPGTLTTEKLSVYKSAGINRLSIGLQAWQKFLLHKMGRIHSAGEFVDNIEKAQKTGFDNINTDLIFGLPGQRLKDWKETLEQVINLNITHISAYSLKIEEDTVFGRLLDSGELTPAEDDLDREMYHYACEKLDSHGFAHYEISNFAKPGFECRHNLVYWKAEEYLGVGAGAHSYLWNKRFSSLCSLQEYITSMNNSDTAVEDIQTIYKEDSMSEFMILGLRLIQGVDRFEFKARFGRDIFDVFERQISELQMRKLLIIERNKIKLTLLGLDLANQVFMEFLV